MPKARGGPGVGRAPAPGKAPPLPPTTGSADDVFGYQAAFERELKRIGEITSKQLATMHAPPAYLPKMSWDVTTASFFKEAQAAIALNAGELALLKQNGFVVSGRLAAQSFAELYYRVFSSDLPVFISADSLLHAWHRSYDAMLEELEQQYLAGAAGAIAAGMAEQLADARRAYGDGVLAGSLGDADYFLAVARSLLAGSPVKGQLGGKVDARVAETLAAVAGEKMQRFELFGGERVVDFSQFKPRGHYENSEALRRYFRGMMWLGRIDLRVGDPEHDPAGRQLGAALVLHDLLTRSGQTKAWQDFDRILQTLVGRTDSMTFAQLGQILKAAMITSPADVHDDAALRDFGAAIAASGFGAQQIRSDYFEVSPLGPDRGRLPRSFTVMGQKFTVDSWALGKVVFSEIVRDGGKVQRRMPSALDVGFAVLGNDAAVPLLVKRIDDRRGVAFRDGLPYQHNLAAVRAVIDSHPAAAWQENLYMGWLGTLRELSAPTTDASYPEAMRTRAWAMRSMNTQLASWAQLRHDTILYVKQSYTAGVTCFHPHGAVDPRPAFWKAFTAMARRAEKLIRDTPIPDRALRDRQAAFYGAFADQLDVLRSIADKQLACTKLTDAEAHVLKDVIQISHGSGFTHYSGWYPKLFYKGVEDSGKEDFIIADVHTDVPAPLVGDPGGVLHQGLGRVDLMMVALEHGDGRIMYVGPTMSHYEHATTGVTRIADSEWDAQVQAGKAPTRPEWTKDYLLP
jgi:hypothetical protein